MARPAVACEVRCSTCPRTYTYDSHDRQGHTKTRCNSCMTNARKDRGLKQRMVNYKGGCCSRCGYKKCLRALGFHHIDPTQKDFGISGAHSRSWESITKELDRCILLCANCHAEIHDEIDAVAQRSAVAL